MAWKKGPLPKGTWGWGGVVQEDQDPRHGFQFASFAGLHAEIFPNGYGSPVRVEANDIAYYDNSLQMPINQHMAEGENDAGQKS